MTQQAFIEASSRDRSTELLDCLKRWRLAIDPSAAIAPSKNQVLVCRDERGRRVLVKVAKQHSRRGLIREATALETLESLFEPRQPLVGVPQVVAFERDLGVLAIAWIEQAETLHDFHQHDRRYSPALGYALGSALAFLHTRTRDAAGTLPDAITRYQDADYVRMFVYVTPEVYAELSPAGLAFMRRVHGHAEAYRALYELSCREDPSCLVHGDLKLANLLWTRTRPRRIVVIDWERACWGDPARDLGALLADYLVGWLSPSGVVERIAEPRLTRFVQAIWQRYVNQRGDTFPLEPDFQLRVMRWAAYALLLMTYGHTEYDGRFDEADRHLTDCALHMLACPAAWAQRLLSHDV
jgi:hypothetical protein